MKKIKLLTGTLTVLAVAWLVTPIIHSVRHMCPVRPSGVREAGAMPQWARRYGVSCSVCHTTVPALTREGYKFRSAGFRMPDEIGNEAKFKDISDMYSVRIREQYKVAGTNTDSAGAKVGATNKFAFHELTFYPITGAIGKYWAAESELTFAPDEHVEVENAYIRATVPINPDLYLTARAGIMHPYEGYGASDRPISNFRPFFQTVNPKNGAFDTGARQFKTDQEGGEVGVAWKDTTLALAVFNGFNTKEGNSGTVGDDNNFRDIQLFFNQMIGDKAAISAEYINGNTGQIYGGGSANGLAAQWVNNYQKGGLYGNYKVLGDKLDLMAGMGINKDHMPASTAVTETNNSNTFNSWGWMGRVQSKIHEHVTGAVAYDTFRPSTKTAANRISAVTLTAALPYDNVKFLIEYQVKRTQRAAVRDTTENLVQAEWMVHF